MTHQVHSRAVRDYVRAWRSTVPATPIRVMSRRVMLSLRTTRAGKRSRELSELARRMKTL